MFFDLFIFRCGVQLIANCRKDSPSSQRQRNSNIYLVIVVLVVKLIDEWLHSVIQIEIYNINMIRYSTWLQLL